MGCPPVRKIIHSLKLVDYLHVQADNPWYNYYVYPRLAFAAFDEEAVKLFSIEDSIDGSTLLLTLVGWFK